MKYDGVQTIIFFNYCHWRVLWNFIYNLHVGMNLHPLTISPCMMYSQPDLNHKNTSEIDKITTQIKDQD